MQLANCEFSHRYGGVVIFCLSVRSHRSLHRLKLVMISLQKPHVHLELFDFYRLETRTRLDTLRRFLTAVAPPEPA